MSYKDREKRNENHRINYHKRMQDPEYAQLQRDKANAWNRTEKGKKATAKYRKEYNSKPEVIAFRNSPEGKALQSKRNKEQKKKHDPDGKIAYERNKIWRANNYERHNARRREYEKRPDVLFKKSLRSRLNTVLNKYTINGKQFGSSKYNIDWNQIVNKLSNDAKLMNQTINSLRDNNYEIDHIIPCRAYNLNDIDEVSKCYNVYNLRWLPGLENASKAHHIRHQDIQIIKTLPKEIYPKSWKGIIPKE